MKRYGSVSPPSFSMNRVGDLLLEQLTSLFGFFPSGLVVGLSRVISVVCEPCNFFLPCCPFLFFPVSMGVWNTEDSE